MAKLMGSKTKQVILVGLSHRTAPAEVRERLSFDPNQRDVALSQLVQSVEEGIILSTCYRTEVYAVTTGGPGSSAWICQFLGKQRGVAPESIQPHIYCLENHEAARHLFAVASGLDSVVLGEPQILGQVRAAFQAAAERGTVGSVLSALFRQAIHTGKRVRSSTEIGRNVLGTGHAAIAAARRASEPQPLTESVALVIGAGQMGALVVSLLDKAGMRSIHIANRTVEKALVLAEQVHGQAWGLDAMTQLLGEVDLVFSATTAAEPIITPAMIAAVRRPPNRPALILIDMGLPRNIDPEVGAVVGFSLFSIDDLHIELQDLLVQQQRELTKAEAIVDEETAEFQAWWRALDAVPTITALRSKLELVRRQELEHYAAKLRSLSFDQYQIVETLTTSIVQKILHQPTVHIKDQADLERGRIYAEVIRELFDIEPSDIDKPVQGGVE